MGLSNNKLQLKRPSKEKETADQKKIDSNVVENKLQEDIEEENSCTSIELS